MIQPKEAQQLVAKLIQPLGTTTMPLPSACGYILGADLPAPSDLPLFDQSAMDGYAIAYMPGAPVAVQTFDCIGEIKAGDTDWPVIKPGQCLRIFTGALVPKEAGCVVMQEKTSRSGNDVQIQTADLIHGHNIRYQGTQITTGATAFRAGILITPGAIGAMASMGIASAPVQRRPAVSILVTGSELRQPGANLKPGEIYESNLKTLEAALSQCGIQNPTATIVGDDEAAIIAVLQPMLETSDLVLLTGGISVGDYDFAGTALRRLGVEEIFYKVSQKPGKPLFFGRINNAFVFALPGNPGSVLTCFYEYVWPAIRRMSGQTDIFLPTRQLPLKDGFANTGDRSVFLKCNIRDEQVVVLDKQGSDMLVSFGHADALVFIPDHTTVAAGELVETHILPHVL
jgi:molybdopterin molybdotransferase